ncbi:ribonuclease HII [Puniceicoccus vermicola]|uniref:Ribonuclease n=1 Tax=Puniceicoccus vermicola TaxID=388746 RepID=A0A7X1B0S8_9BACT|nr:ribonuclease HII [Puniceicoccus vermicola]MBC2603520.1 ribonuclease HII [Puniceicoccus vermicola]
MSATLWKHDRTYPRQGAGLVGVDEAGRGCLAGPVFAAAVYLPESIFSRRWSSFKAPRIDDSKKLSEAERNTALRFLQNLRDQENVRMAVGTADVEEIDTHNILGATTLAMGRALKGLGLSLASAELPLWSASADEPPPPVLIDGRPVKRLPYTHEGLVQGDGKSLTIALASVLAKVERDRWMVEAHQQFPAYGWSRNRGYGTAEHRRGIQETGPCRLHRKLFLRKILSHPRDGVSS